MLRDQYAHQEFVSCDSLHLYFLFYYSTFTQIIVASKRDWGYAYVLLLCLQMKNKDKEF